MEHLCFRIDFPSTGGYHAVTGCPQNDGTLILTPRTASTGEPVIGMVIWKEYSYASEEN